MTRFAGTAWEAVLCDFVPPSGYIYGLFHPETGDLRYIGKTLTSPEARLKRHIRRSRHQDHHVYRWIKSIEPLTPEVRVLHTAPKDELDSIEVSEIARQRSLGVDLCNMTEGGEGGSGKHSPATIAKMSATKLGHKTSAETRAKISASLKGRKLSTTHRGNIAKGHRGLKYKTRSQVVAEA